MIFFYQNKYIENIARVQIIASSVSCLLLNHELAFEYGLAQNTQLKLYRHKKCIIDIFDHAPTILSPQNNSKNDFLLLIFILFLIRTL